MDIQLLNLVSIVETINVVYYRYGLKDKYLILKIGIYAISKTIFNGNLTNLYETSFEFCKKVQNRILLYQENPKTLSWDYAEYLTRNKKNLFEKSYQALLLIIK